MENYSAILWQPWKAGLYEDMITGAWAEDGNEYNLSVPPQLRDMIISLQNQLAKEYQEFEHKKEQLETLKKEVERARLRFNDRRYFD